MRPILVCLAGIILCSLSAEARVAPRRSQPVLGDESLELRKRYERVLERNPMQEQAFERAYTGYLETEGIDVWVAALEAAIDAGQNERANCILLGRIRARQFEPALAIKRLERAGALGEKSAEFMVLLGELYYRVGADQRAAVLLSEAIDLLEDPDKRAQVCRVLGNLYLRQGMKDEAVATWKRLIEQAPVSGTATHSFALAELAQLYEEHRMWREAIEVYASIIAASPDEAYRQCRSLRAIARCHLRLEEYEPAIAAVHRAIELVAPGNWLFEDLKGMLVSVYEEQGDLEGLSVYLETRLAESAGGLELHELLAETYARMKRFEAAEAAYRSVLERAPDRLSAHERLIDLYARQGQPGKVAERLEELAARYPQETDFLRRLGEHHLQQGNTDLAKAVWRRALGEAPGPARLAEVAGWHEGYEFPGEAVALYRQALAEKDEAAWAYRLAALLYAQGEEDAAVAAWLSVLDEATSPAGEYAELAAVFETHGFLEKAEELLAEAVARDPEELAHVMALGRNLMAQERPADALPHFLALARQEENLFLRDRGERGMLDAYVGLDQLEEKRREWESEIEEAPENPEGHRRLARLYERIANRFRAMELYEKCVELAPEEAAYGRLLAKAYLGLRYHDKAIAAFERLMEIDKGRAPGYARELLNIFLRLDDEDRALPMAEGIVEWAPNSAEARLDLAEVYGLYGHADAALREYRHAIHLDTEEAAYQRAYAEALAAQRRWGEARSAFEKLLTMATSDEGRIDAIARLSAIHTQQGALDELIRDFRVRLRRTPKRLAAYEELAAVYRQAGQRQQAFEVLQEAYEYVDDREEVLRLLMREAYGLDDLNLVVEYYEQLLAQSAKPSAMEFERLGSTYAKLGHTDKALETWARITAQTPDDPEAHKALARVYLSEGFPDEGLAEKARALELAPYDYETRFEYAMDLSGAERHDEAMAQLRSLLELGSGEEADAEPKKAAERSPLARGRVLTQRLHTPRHSGFAQGFRGASPSGRQHGRQWHGTYDAFRPQVVATLVSLAQVTMGVDALVQEYEAYCEARPDDLRALEDLQVVYEASQNWRGAIDLTAGRLEKQPNDVDLLARSALLYAQLQDSEKVAAAYRRILELRPSAEAEVLPRLMMTYHKQGLDEEAERVAETLVENYPDQAGVIGAVGRYYFEAGDMEAVRQLYAEALPEDPASRLSMQLNLADMLKRAGRLDEAKSVYEEVLLSGATFGPPGGARPMAANPAVFSPPLSRHMYGGMHTGMNVMQYLRGLGLPGVLMGPQETAFRELLLNELDEEARLARMDRLRQQMRTLQQSGEAEGGEDLVLARRIGLMLLACDAATGDFEKALAVLDEIGPANPKTVAWANLRLFLLNQLGRYEAMLRLYETLPDRYPILRSQLDAARGVTLRFAGRNDEAKEIHVRLARQARSPQSFLSAIRALIQSEFKEEARELLEEHLAGNSRNTRAMIQLAQLHAQDLDYARAIELVREVRERRGRQRGAGQFQPFRASWQHYPGMQSAFHHYYPGATPGTNPSESLRLLHTYSVSAGEVDALIAEFEAQAAERPDSVQVHHDLANLYALQNRPDKQAAVYRALLERRPNDRNLRWTLARIYAQHKAYSQAVNLVEADLSSRRQVRQAMGHELSEWYHRARRGKELNALTESLIRGSTDANMLSQWANQMTQDGDFDRAIEVYRRVLTLQPADHHHYRLADCLLRAGKPEEALAVYNRWLDSPFMRTQRWLYHQAFEAAVVTYDRLGRLGELTAKMEQRIEANPDDVAALLATAYIARQEKRFDDAVALFKTVITKHRIGNVFQELQKLQVRMGDLDGALATLENATAQQGHGNYQQMIEFALARGDRETARDFMRKQFLIQGQSPHMLGENMGRFIEFGMWEAAEDYFHRHAQFAARDQYAYRSLVEKPINLYLEHGLMESLVREHFAQASENQTKKLIEIVAGRHRNSHGRHKTLLRMLLDRAPGEFKIVEAIAGSHERNGQAEEAVRVLRDFAAAHPDAPGVAKTLGHKLLQAGYEREALDTMTAWVRAEPKLPNVQELANALKQRGYKKRLLALRDEMVGAQPPEKQVYWTAYFERLLHEPAKDQHEQEREKKAARTHEAFAENPDSFTFNAYAEALANQGKESDAYRLYKQYEDEPFMEDWRRSSERFVPIMLKHGDTAGLAEILWDWLRYGGSQSDPWRLRNTFSRPNDHAKQLLAELAARAMAEQPRHAATLNTLSELTEAAGETEKALELAEAVIAENPQDTRRIRRKANLLVKLGRHEERIALYEELRQHGTLKEQFSNGIALARAYHGAGQTERAMAIADDLRPWSGDFESRRELGRLLAECGQSEAAIADLEFAARSTRYQRHDTATLLMGCYLKAGRTEEALAFWRGHRHQMNAYQLENLLRDKNAGGAEVPAPAAITLLREVVKYYPRHQFLDRYVEYAEDDVDLTTLEQIFSAAYHGAQHWERDNLLQSAARWLVDSGHLDAVLTDEKLSGNPALAHLGAATVRCLLHEKSDKDGARAMAARLKGPLADNLHAMMQVAETFRHRNEPQAAAWYARAAAHPRASQEQREKAAKNLVQLDAKKQAAALYKEIIAVHPSLMVADLAAMAGLGDAELLENLREGLVAFSGSPEEERYYLAQLAYEAGNKTEAVAMLAEIAEPTQLTEAQQAAMANILQEAGQQEEALELFEKLPAAGPAGKMTREALSDAIVKEAGAGSLVHAHELYAKLMEAMGAKAPETAEPGLDLAAMDPDYREAFMRALEQMPGDQAEAFLSQVGGHMSPSDWRPLAEASLAIARAHARIGEHDEAARILEATFAEQPDQYRDNCHEIRAIYLSAGKREALTEFADALCENALTANQQRSLANAFFWGGDFGRRADLMARSLELDASDTRLIGELAGYQEDLGRYQDALVTGKRQEAQWRGPHTQATTLGSQTEALLRAHLLTDTLEELKANVARQLEAQPESPPYRMLAALIALHEKRFGEAITGLRSLLVPPAPPFAAKALLEAAMHHSLAFDATDEDTFALLDNHDGITDHALLRDMALLCASRGDWVAANRHWAAIARAGRSSDDLLSQMRTYVFHNEIGRAEAAYAEALNSGEDLRHNAHRAAVGLYLAGAGFEDIFGNLASAPLDKAGRTRIEAYIDAFRSNPAGALPLLEHIARGEPGTRWLMMKLVRAYATSHNYGKALRCCEALSESHPADEALAEQHALALKKRDAYEQAIQLLETRVEKRPKAENTTMLAVALLEGGHGSTLLRLCEGAVDDASETTLQPWQAADYVADLGAVDLAIQMIETWRQADPSNERRRQYLDFLVRRGLAAGPRYPLEKLRTDYVLTNATDALLELSLVHRGDIHKAAALFTDKYLLYEDFTTHPNELYGYAESVVPDAFLDAVENEAAHLQTPRLETCRGIAAAYGYKKSWEKAIEIGRRALALAPKHRQTAIDVGEWLLEAQQPEEALAVLDGLRPYDSLDTEARAEALRARVLSKAGGHAQALEILEAVAAWSRAPKVHATVGKAYVALGEYAAARPHLEAANNYAAGQLYTFPSLIKSLAMTGAEEQARARYRLAYPLVHLPCLPEWMAEHNHTALAFEMILDEFPLAFTTDKFKLAAGWALALDRMPELRKRVAGIFRSSADADRNVMLHSYADLLIEHSLVEQAFDELAAKSDRILEGALLFAFQELAQGKDKSAAKALLAQASALKPAGFYGMWAMAQGLEACGDNEGAAKWYRLAAALPSNRIAQHTRAAQRFSARGNTEAALAACEAVFAMAPGVMPENESALLVYARHAAPEELEAVLETMATHAAFEEQGTYLRALCAHESGSPEALDLLSSLAAQGRLRHYQMQAITTRLGKAGRAQEAEAIYQRIANGGYGEDEAVAAMQELDSDK